MVLASRFANRKHNSNRHHSCWYFSVMFGKKVLRLDWAIEHYSTNNNCTCAEIKYNGAFFICFFGSSVKISQTSWICGNWARKQTQNWLAAARRHCIPVTDQKRIETWQTLRQNRRIVLPCRWWMLDNPIEWLASLSLVWLLGPFGSSCFKPIQVEYLVLPNHNVNRIWSMGNGHTKNKNPRLAWLVTLYY